MIVVLLDAMETHLEDSTMMRNGCLTLCQFRIPQDVVSISPVMLQNNGNFHRSCKRCKVSKIEFLFQNLIMLSYFEINQ